jgi:pimeloyl-ACP methyl ester carboxylesterase
MDVPLHYARTSDGVSIAYIAVGDGPPLVFASNIFGDAFFYRRLPIHPRGLTDGLAALGWRIVRHDVRGMGSSDRHDVALDLEGRLRDVEAVTERLGLERFMLAGTDIGAATAMAYAARYPDRVTKLVLISPWASGTQMFALPSLRVAKAAMMDGDSDWSVFTNVLAGVATKFGTAALGHEVALAMRDSTSPQGLAAYYRTTEAIDVAHLLPRVRAETLVIHEQAFPFGSFELCKDVAAGIPDARLVVLPGPSIVGPAHDGYAEAIDRFLRGGGTAAVATALQTGEPLTARERAIINRLARGLTNKEIAHELAIAVPTVERHLANIYTKIGARRRADATAYAIRHGLDRPP